MYIFGKCNKNHLEIFTKKTKKKIEKQTELIYT